jgi:asparagine synthase (glutamine-hydrolysing)
MCGIFSLLNYESESQYTPNFIETQFKKGEKRGPEFSTLSKVGIKVMYGFHRLAINGLNSASNQPLIQDDILLICNGEIYNYRELYALMGIVPKTDSDCEVIIHLYKKYGIEHTLQLLDGVFSFILLDQSVYTHDSRVYIARDPYGVRPLYIMHNKDESPDKEHCIGFASELKVLSEFVNTSNKPYTIEHFSPGTYSVYKLPTTVSTYWRLEHKHIKYHTTSFSYQTRRSISGEINKVISNIQNYLINAVEKRCITTERPIACLLSGGLDSSLIAALVSEYHKKNGLPAIETYSIGLTGSEDLRCAKLVAEYIGSNHTEVLLEESDFTNAIPNVIRDIESYDTTSVRASIGNYLLGKYISENSDAKVIFNGDGSDELCGGYLYMGLASDVLEFDKECRRLLKDIHAFDVLRSDKCISSHGLEPRTPFLDRSWVQYYLSIPAHIRFNTNKTCEKFLVRQAFDYLYFSNSNGKPLLPKEILWRRKEAFSDGVSNQSRSLYQILQEYAIEQMKDVEKKEYAENPPTTAEQAYYRKVFEDFYPGHGKIVPYFWMPKYVDATDASARTLDIYNTKPPSP